MILGSFTMSREELVALIPPVGDGPAWVDHAVKVNEETYLIVDVEELGTDVRLSIEPAPFL